MAITVIAIAAIAGCGILANSLRHRSRQLNDMEMAYSKLLADKEKVEVLLEKSRSLVRDLSDSNYELKVRAQASEKKLRFAHQRHPKTKALLPMGTNPDGSKV